MDPRIRCQPRLFKKYRFILDIFMVFITTLVRKGGGGGGGLNAVFDSQAENFLSQKGQSTKSTEIQFCW